MKHKEYFFAIGVFLLVAVIFFHKFFLFGEAPFPGDLLIAEYNPWKTYSYLGYNPGSFPNKAQYFDVLRQLYPWKTFSIGLLKIGEIPLWNPHNFSGAPFLANFQSAIFYPLNFLYFILPQIQAWSILVLFQPLFASLFTYLFARKIGISSIASLFSSVSYGFSSFMIVWLEYNTIGHVIMWLPLLLLCIENLIRKIETKWAVIFIFSSIASLFAGHPQIFTYSLLFISAYFVYRIFSFKKFNGDRVKSLLFFSLLIVLGVGIGAVQIVPGIELIRESARVAHDYNFLIHKILIQPWQFIMIVVPDFFGNPATRNYWLYDTYVGKVTYVGVIPLFFALFSLRYLRNRTIRFFLASGIVVLLLASLNPITALLYKFNIPFVSASAPTLSIFLFCFCVNILSGFGVDIWIKEKQNAKKMIVTVVPLLLVIVFLWTAISFFPNLISDKLQENSTIAYRNLFLAAVLAGVGLVLILIGTLKRKLIYIVLILLFVTQTADLFRFFTKFNPFVPKETVFPSTPAFEFLKEKTGIDRFWGYGTASIEANFATQYSFLSPDGYDPLYPKRYGEFIQASRDGKIKTEFTRQTRSDAVLAPGFGELDLSSNINRLKILDLLGVKYVLDRVENGSTERTFPKVRFKLIYDKDGWRIYENLKALPRAFLVSDYKAFKSREEFESIFFDEEFDPLKTILLENTPSRWQDSDLDSFEVDNSETMSVTHYSPNKVVISVDTNSDKLLFLSDNYYPGWKAFIDNKETKIYRANYAFRAVVVPEGSHEIQFLYDPDSFKLGFKISIVSVIFMIAFLIFIYFNKRVMISR